MSQSPELPESVEPSGLPALRFPAVRLRARRRDGRIEVWDALRGIYLVLTPEEWVRQHLIAYLTEHCGVQPLRIVQEYPVPLNGQPQRADVVVVDDAAQPLLLAECKAPDVRIDRTTLQQAVRYNSVLGARYLVLTNGLTHYCYERDEQTYTPLADFPRLLG
ncbi:MAG: type I restriction enzyme HsdR N-terminal domain-containing protein [Alistipes senegalensis]|nr:type I restriction enzyme HsdR N-terminal domain-containing protein [Bacteroides cellulosilyticus]MCM1352695.1 type I restriction enzyme HsdR N-terminal domain-containing protein [Alistipes senegalensis]